MDLEESVGVESLKDRCESCGVALTPAEIEAAVEGASDGFLCSRCAAEQVPVTDEIEEI
jgi:hypothetical protein